MCQDVNGRETRRRIRLPEYVCCAQFCYDAVVFFHANTSHCGQAHGNSAFPPSFVCKEVETGNRIMQTNSKNSLSHVLLCCRYFSEIFCLP